ncbi:hypothetical protein ACFQFH_11250 [Halobaculum halobium]|uniref:Flagellin N-terminal-like domain-containing protein n=1 Tax=Halobaculum halobium TaxID=3032281 RepID=A0ABD5TBP4_9EURY|nr:hypothetical protein [Halobaculum sp. SYNS20]
MPGRTGASGTADLILTLFLLFVAVVALALLVYYTTDLLASLPDPLAAV